MKNRLETHKTNVSKSSAIPESSGFFRQRPFSPATNQEIPDLPISIDSAARFGHNFSQLQVVAPTPETVAEHTDTMFPALSSSEPQGVMVQREGDDDPQPFYPFMPPSPLALQPPSLLRPLNFGLLNGDPLGGSLGYGAPLSPLLPELELDPRAGLGRPTPLGDSSGLGAAGDTDTTPSLPWGIGLQGRFGEDEQSIAAGLRFSF